MVKSILNFMFDVLEVFPALKCHLIFSNTRATESNKTGLMS